MKSRARWAEDAIDLSTNLAKAAEQLHIGMLADKTGLSVRTIEDSLTREKITAPDNPRGALDRPAYMVGGDPLWSHEQLTEYYRRMSATADRKDVKVDLPLVTPEEARERGLVTTSAVGKLLKVHDQTVRRWEANYQNYPPKVARQSRNGLPGVPEHIRELAKIIEWAIARNEERRGTDVPLIEIPADATA
jgi:hypothetical protein